jgi:hypothetical protein
MKETRQNSRNPHLSEKDIEKLVISVIEKKGSDLIKEEIWQHLLDCGICLKEIQESLLDILALHETVDYMALARATHKKNTTPVKSDFTGLAPFTFLIKKLTTGFELMESNLKLLQCIPLPSYRSEKQKTGKRPKLQEIKMILLFNQLPMAFSIKSGTDAFLHFHWEGLGPKVKNLSVYQNLQGKEKKLLGEILINNSQADIRLPLKNIQSDKGQPAVLELFCNQSLLGTVNLENP